jgi:hypothetical protein
VEIWTTDRDPEVMLQGIFQGLCGMVNDFRGTIVVNLTDREVLDKDAEEGG